jgi:hypothetical protein
MKRVLAAISMREAREKSSGTKQPFRERRVEKRASVPLGIRLWKQATSKL